MKIRDLVEFMFLPVLTAGVWVLWDLNKGVSELNVQVAVLIAKGHDQKERLEKVENEIQRLKEELNRRKR